MFKCYTKNGQESPIIIVPVVYTEFTAWLEGQVPAVKNWISSSGYIARPGAYTLLASSEGALSRVIIAIDSANDRWALAQLPNVLPNGHYLIEAPSISQEKLDAMALGWGLGAYRFTRYKLCTDSVPRLILTEDYNYGDIENKVAATYLVRDLINTPTEDMGPEELAQAALNLGHSFGAKTVQVIGDELLKRNYPAIHAVGRASSQAPRLIELLWGAPNHPKVTLVGKGVCFDSGGLDIKPANGMALMKKDMGGAAHVLGLARLIMSANLPVNLRVLIPAVENAISGNAYRPGDIFRTRKGLSVEIGDTDAEGRVVLADALTEAAADNPELVMDFATLTGAARVALGPDIPVYFTPNEAVAQGLNKASSLIGELVWQLPLYAPYGESLNSSLADINNRSTMPYGGAITAALFLKEFIGETDWLHFDIMAWNIKARPGRPEGGEAMGLQAAFAYLKQRFVS